MASQAHKFSEFGDHSPLHQLKHAVASGNAAQLYQFPKLTPAIEVDRYEDTSLARGVCVAFALEAVAGIAIYLVWALLHTIR